MGVAGCGGSSSPPRADTPTSTPTPIATPAPPALCTELKVRKVGTVTAPAATELSGLALSRSGTLWTHNDSGDGPRVLALDRRGRLQREVVLNGAEAIDWEDIAVRGRTVYVGDIGDNLAARPNVTVYRFREPPPGVTSVTPERIDLRYTDGAHDAETLLVDPRSGAIIVITKDIGGTSIRTNEPTGGRYSALSCVLKSIFAGVVADRVIARLRWQAPSAPPCCRPDP